MVPGDDPTLLFTNAGMNQFKDVFLGFDKRPYTRASDRAEMHPRRRQAQRPRERRLHGAPPHVLRDAGQLQLRRLLQARRDEYAWELLTVHFKLPAEKLWATVYAEDDEAYDIWLKDDRPAGRAHRAHRRQQGRALRVRQLLDDGRHRPLRPVLEIFYDHGPEVAGGPPGSAEQDGDRYIEIWNNVFMQFNRTEDGVMHPLPKPSVDTGMGLERLTAVLQHVHSNYEIDLFAKLLAATRDAVSASGAAPIARPADAVAEGHRRPHPRLRVHGGRRRDPGQRRPRLRAAPHRAARDPPRLQARRAQAVLPQAGCAAGRPRWATRIPSCGARAARVTEVLKVEEERFFQTIANGMEILEAALSAVRKADRRRHSRSSCTTPTASRSTSPPMCAANAASRSTRPASTLR